MTNRLEPTRAAGMTAYLLAIATLVLAPPLWAAPRPLSPVELAAVRLASLHHEAGPEAWWEELSPSSPLATLGREAALREIEARVGRPDGTRWTLQLTDTAAARPDRAVFTVGFPSGVEEVLTLDFDSGEGGFLLRSIRGSAELAPQTTATVAMAAAAPAGPQAETGAGADGGAGTPGARSGSESAARSSESTPSLFEPGLLAAASVGLLLLALVFRRRRAVALSAAAAAALLLAWTAFGFIRSAGGDRAESELRAAARNTAAAEAGAASDARRLGDLVPLRHALSEPDPAGIETALEAIAAGSAQHRVARLWYGQYLLAEQDLDAVEALLTDYPATRPVQQAELLRARLGFLRFAELEAAAAYERALETGGGYDDLVFEAAQVFDFLGFEEKTDGLYDRLKEMGSRNPELYYRLAGRSLLEGWNAQATQYFEQGWRLYPLERHEILGRPLLAALTQDFSIRALLKMDDVEEPAPPCAAAAAPPFEFPPSASTRVIGSLFVAEFLDSELWVPNGCGLAAPGTAYFEARAWRRRNDTLALAELPVLIKAAQSKGVFVLPRLRDRVEEAAEALARQRRWDEVLELTAGVAQELRKVPAGLVRVRARALKETGRLDEARELLVKLAAINMRKRRPDPGTLLQLADLMVAGGKYDVAVRLIEKADASIPADIGYSRIQQIYMEKQLASAYAVHTTEHFEIRYPQRRNPYLAERIGEILEAERKRLAKWVPVGGETIEVHLLPWGDFRTAWSTSVEILGLFDGKIRLPFAEVQSFNPVVVSVLTHELAHAMIDGYTGSRAPHWLHEGLAQHVQMVQGRINPIEGYAAKKNLLAFPLVESVLQSFAAPAMIGVAYDEALWTLHYLETVHGTRAIRRLLDAFRDGMNTEEAIQSALGKGLEEFDRELWDWCLHRAPAAWKGQVVRYDG